MEMDNIDCNDDIFVCVYRGLYHDISTNVDDMNMIEHSAPCSIWTLKRW